MTQLFTNNAATATVGAITNVATSITVADGSKFPAPVAPDFALLTLVGLDGNGNENAWEVVKLTERAANVLTVVRGQEGTAAAAWADATRIELRLTAAGMSAKLDADLSTLTDAGALDGTETLPVNKTGAKRTTVQKILDWIKTQAITWAAKQTFSAGVDSVLNFGGSGAANVKALAAGTANSQRAGYSFYPTFGATADYATRRAADIWAGFDAGTWGAEHLSFGVGDAGDVQNQTTERVRIDATGSLELKSQGARIRGDFSNASLASRVAFQTNTANAATNIHAIPNGTSRQSGFKAETDPALASGVVASIDALETDARISSSTRGAFAQQALTFYIGATEAFRITPSRRFEIGTSALAPGLFIGRGDTANEGGQLELARATDNASAAVIDVFGNTATPDLRVIINSLVSLTVKGTGNVEHTNYTKLGESSPAIKVKKLTGTTGSAANTTGSVAHGVDVTKILSVSGYFINNASQRVSFSFTRDSGAQLVELFWDATNIHTVTGPGTTSACWSKSFTIFITYEE